MTLPKQFEYKAQVMSDSDNQDDTMEEQTEQIEIIEPVENEEVNEDEKTKKKKKAHFAPTPVSERRSQRLADSKDKEKTTVYAQSVHKMLKSKR